MFTAQDLFQYTLNRIEILQGYNKALDLLLIHAKAHAHAGKFEYLYKSDEPGLIRFLMKETNLLGYNVKTTGDSITISWDFR